MSSAGLSAQTKPIDFLTAVSETPAFTYLGLAPTNVQRPGGLRDIGAAVLNSVSVDGKPQQGLALDASVWNLIPGFDVPLDKYRRNPLYYALGNLQASLATGHASGDSAALVASFGLRAVLLDRSDPLLDEQVRSRLAAGLATCAPDQPGGTGQTTACADTVTENIIGRYTTQRWNAAQIAVAAAWGAHLPNAAFSHARYGGMSLWAVGSLPLGKPIQLIAQAVYKKRNAIDTIPRYSAFNAGGRAVLGSATFNGFLEYAREWRSPNTGAGQRPVLDKDIGGWSTGFEFRLMSNTWLSGGVGTRFDALGKADKSGVFAGIRWGVTSESRITKLRS